MNAPVLDTAPAAILHRVSMTYGEGAAAVRALEEVSLEVRRRELTVLMGPSGSGKTSLLQVLGCLRRPDAGEVVIEGRKVSGLDARALSEVRRQQIGFVFQQYNLLPTLRAWENIAVALELQGFDGPELESESRGLLTRFGLDDRADAFPAELSGGQKQRVAIARAIVAGPALVLADEPTAALDGQSGLNVTRVMRELAAEHGRAVVIVTHDARLQRFADTVIQLEDGKITGERRNVAAPVATPAEETHALA